jgi:redox-sensitive bicupin YhaK (pirin superfamily)
VLQAAVRRFDSRVAEDDPLDRRSLAMNWMPDQDPVLGDNALDLVIVPRARDLGGFEVRRALPHGKRQMVGPFIFFDQMGPVQFIAGQGTDVRPHPHIGLATVTYLFDGRIMDRDSEGNALDIVPGEINLMTAGAASPTPSARPVTPARPAGRCSAFRAGFHCPKPEEIAQSFQHFDAAGLPVVADRGVWARVIAGSAFGRRSPVATLSETLYAEVSTKAPAPRSTPLGRVPTAQRQARAITLSVDRARRAGRRRAR